MCTALYKHSPKSYKFLSSILPIPCMSTLDRELQRIPLTTGCNSIIIKYLTLLASEVEEKDKNVILMWDEMEIQATLYYCKIADYIIGFEDWGWKRTTEFADHAITFLITFMGSGKYIPLGYGFCKGATKSDELVPCIKQWINVLHQCGFNVIMTVCDQRGGNMAAIRKLREEEITHDSKLLKYVF